MVHARARGPQVLPAASILRACTATATTDREKKHAVQPVASANRIKNELNIEWQKTLSEVIRSGIATGEFNEVDADAVSWKALSLLDGLSLQVVAHPTVIERGRASELATNSIERDLGLELGALRAASAPS